jgi:hypothetical protein
VIISNLTQVDGLAVLLSASAAYSPFGRFMVVILMITIPDSLAFVAIVYCFAGAAKIMADQNRMYF